MNDPTTARETLVHIGSVLRDLLSRDLPSLVLVDERGRRLVRPHDLAHSDYLDDQIFILQILPGFAGSPRTLSYQIMALRSDGRIGRGAVKLKRSVRPPSSLRGHNFPETHRCVYQCASPGNRFLFRGDGKRNDMAFGASRPQRDIHATAARAPDVVRWAAVIAGVRGTLAGLANGSTAWGLLFLVSLTTFLPGAVNLTSKLDAGVRQGATTFGGYPGAGGGFTVASTLWTGFWSLLVGLVLAVIGGVLRGRMRRPVVLTDEHVRSTNVLAQGTVNAERQAREAPVAGSPYRS